MPKQKSSLPAWNPPRRSRTDCRKTKEAGCPHHVSSTSCAHFSAAATKTGLSFPCTLRPQAIILDHDRTCHFAMPPLCTIRSPRFGFLSCWQYWSFISTFDVLLIYASRKKCLLQSTHKECLLQSTHVATVRCSRPARAAARRTTRPRVCPRARS